MDEPEFMSPNGGAYEQSELRTGPPLSYVAEKLRHSLAALHAELLGREEKSLNLRTSLLCGSTAYLALHNMLGLAHAPRWFERVSAFSTEEFRDWLDRVYMGGSVRG